jgi:hypothetical protein
MKDEGSAPSSEAGGGRWWTLWERASRVGLVVLATVTLSPCRSSQTAQLVLGVQSDAMGRALDSLHIVAKVDGVVAADETLRPPHGAMGVVLPWERKLQPTAPGARVDVVIEGFGPELTSPALTRVASTRIPAGPAEQLMRVPLESRCVIHPPPPTPPPGAAAKTRLLGPLSGPTCAPPSTCILGACQSGAVAPADLEPYIAKWPMNAPDRCKGKNPGPPVVQVGTGQGDYLPLEPGQTLQAEEGPQGGHHLWIAVRMKNLKQSLSVTRIEGVQPDTGAIIPPSAFVFTYTPTEGGYCKVYGMRYQLDNQGIDYRPFLGKPLDVTVTVTDPMGTSAKATTRINVAPTLVNP